MMCLNHHIIKENEVLRTDVENYPFGVDVRSQDGNGQRQSQTFQIIEVQLFQGENILLMEVVQHFVQFGL